MIRFLPLLLLFCLVLAAPASPAEPTAFFQGKGLSVELVSDSTTAAPGSTFHLGLWIKHDPEYHTYWLNPGLAGVATKLNPKLPAGYQTGTLIYPPPDKVKMASLDVHGYERDVLIALPVTVPADAAPGSLTIPVECTWMCCRNVCNPGLANLNLTIQIDSKSQPSATWEPKFKDLLASQPPAIQGWTLRATRFEKEIELIAQPPAGLTAPEAPQFFSLDNLICSHPPQSWQKDGPGYRVRLELSDFQPKDTSQLRGLLFGKNSWLADKTAPYVAINVPVDTAKR
jgi:DsbC/DsbD-like thiol-disulfide interchange protein